MIKKSKKKNLAEDNKKDGYVVLYDTCGDGLQAGSAGLYVVWGDEELKNQILYLFDEIREDGYTLDDIVVLKIDDSRQLKLTSKEVIKTEIEETLEFV